MIADLQTKTNKKQERKRPVINAGIDRLHDLDARRILSPLQAANQNSPLRRGKSPETFVKDTP